MKFNLKIAQNKQILEEKYLVPQEFSPELEQLLKNINSRGLTKFILNKIRQTPIKNSQQFEEIKKIVQEQNVMKKDPIDEKINNLTQNVNYREWVKNLFTQKKIKEEDFVKIQNLLNTYTKLISNNIIPTDFRDISKFKDDSELNKYLNTFSSKTSVSMEDIKSGYKILDQNDKVKLLEVTEEETLKQICDVGYNINWCVIHGSWNIYSPQRYYCFIINGNPEVLVHPESGQIKDINDHPLQNGLIISMIDPFIKKFKLDKAMETETEDIFEPDDLHDDFEIYREKLKTMEEFKKRKNDENFIRKELSQEPINIMLLDKNVWGKYVDTVLENILDIDYSIAPIELLDYLARYCKIHNIDEDFATLESQMIKLINIGDNFSRYHKIVPEVLRTEKVSNMYKEMIANIYEKIEQRGEAPVYAIQYCANLLKTGKAPQILIDNVYKRIEDIGEIPNYSTEWCEEQLKLNNKKLVDVIEECFVDSKFVPRVDSISNWFLNRVEKNEVSDKVKESINEMLSKSGNCPEVIRPWCKKILESEKAPQSWLDGINKHILLNYQPPAFARDWAIRKIQENKIPKQWYEIIEKHLTEKVSYTYFFNSVCSKQLEDGKATQVYYDRINEDIEKNGMPPTFARDWCKKQLEEGKAPKSWIDRIGNDIKEGRTVGEYANKWAENLIDEDKAPKDWYEQCYRSIEKVGRPNTIFTNWARIQLSKGPRKELVDAITKCFVDNRFCPEFASYWCNKQLMLGKAPQIWIDIITEQVVRTGECPPFAIHWCKKIFNEGRIPRSWLTKIDDLIERGRDFPDFAIEWADKIMKENPPEKWIKIADQHIRNRGYVSNVFQNWAKEKIESGKAPAEWLKGIYHYVDVVGEAPTFAYFWLKDRLKNGDVELESLIEKRLSQYKCPQFANEWYMEKRKKEFEKTSNWYNFYRKIS